MKTYLNLIFICCIGLSCFAQITFIGCDALFDSQTFILDNLGADATGHNMFETTPITGDQPCGGVGACEFQIIWNDTLSQWEFRADDGNGNFSNTYLIYSNATASMPNPPSLTLGTWVEETAQTTGDCNGDLSMSNSTLSGDVQDTALTTFNNSTLDNTLLFPNPATEIINIQSPRVIDKVSVYDLNGKLLLKHSINVKTINISKLSKGIYYALLRSENRSIIRKVIVR